MEQTLEFERRLSRHRDELEWLFMELYRWAGWKPGCGRRGTPAARS